MPPFQTQPNILCIDINWKDYNYHQYNFSLSGAGTLVASLTGVPDFNGQISDGTVTESLLTFTAAVAYRF